MPHEHYEHYSTEMIHRLDGIYGKVDARINAFICTRVYGRRVLEVGCGFGQLVDYLRQQGFMASGTDLLADWIAAGQVRFPYADLHIAQPDTIDFPDKSVDTVILKEILHHVYDEADIYAFLAEVRRVCRKRLIILDPNPTWMLLLSRRLIRHVDPVCFPQQAEHVLMESGFRIVERAFSELLALPLSGGFISVPLIPNNGFGNIILTLDRFLQGALRAFGLGRWFCWRYLLVADLDS
jgi:SAM-dependent methyltransferase